MSILTGTAKAETITGSTSADTLSGLAGNDRLNGGDGNDTLRGGAGNDRLIGGEGSDTYLFNLGDGQDQIYESDRSFAIGSTLHATDRLVFGGGIKLTDLEFRATAGEDLYISIKGTDDRITVIDFFAMADVKIECFQFADGAKLDWTQIAALAGKGTSNSDYIFGAEVPETISGLTGDDHIEGRGGNDVLAGDDGNDRLFGGTGSDDLTGGTGNDYLEGGSGSDTYHFNLGDGADTISETDAVASANGYADFTDTIEFGAGIAAADIIVRLTRDEWSQQTDLVFYISGTHDRILIKGFLDDMGNQIETVKFSDGTVWGVEDFLTRALISTQSADHIVGTSDANVISGAGGDDHLEGNGGNDRLEGGKGNDILEGGLGADTYVFVAGDGNDTINEQDDETDGLQSDKDIIEFGQGIDKKDIEISRDDNGFHIYFANSTDSIQISSGGDSEEKFAVEELKFENGDILTLKEINEIYHAGTSRDDIISGSVADETLHGQAGNDHLSGSGGTDLLVGGTGNDTVDYAYEGTEIYLYEVGDGNDTITYDTWSEGDSVDGGQRPRGFHALQFGAGITSDNIRFSQNADFDLIVSFANGQHIQIESGASRDSRFGHVIDEYQFNDGSKLGWEDVVKTLFSGTSGNDTFFGLGWSNRISGALGDDKLFGYSFGDILNGGDGNDYLSGGAGNDTYLYNKGDDHDVINEMPHGWDGTTDAPAGTDTIAFGAGITLANLHFTSNSSGDLVIAMGGTDSIVVKNAFTRHYQSIEYLQFADKSTYQFNTIAATMRNGTSGNDYIWGTAASETLGGLNGKDSIDGAAGDDILVGGAGADLLSGGTGRDTASYATALKGVTINLGFPNANGGDARGDTFNSIENILGSKFADSISGDGGSNRLDGGHGNDWLWGGGGRDIFIFGKAYGKDTIADFSVKSGKSDFIDLSSASGITDYKDLVSHHLKVSGHDLVIHAQDGSTLKLVGLGAGHLNAGDFIF